MNVGGLIKSNTTSNAYGCCCQFLSRIKPVIKNSIKSLSSFPPDSIEFQYHAVLIDIYSQIKEGSDDIEIFSFINTCKCENKTTVDFITILTTVLLYFDPCFKSDDDYSQNSIFYTSLLCKNPIKFQKSVIFDFELINKRSKQVDLIDSIHEKYDFISNVPNILLFRPTNNCKFELSFYLPMETHENEIYFSLFAFIITKKENKSHYILYISQSSNIKDFWLCIDDDQISVTSYKSLLNLSYSEDNNFVMFAFTENFHKSVEFLFPELKTSQKIDLTNYEIGNQSDLLHFSQISNTYSSNSQNSHKPLSNPSSPSIDLSTTSPIKSKETNESSKNSDFYDKLQPFIDHSNDLCQFTIKNLSPKKMIFEDLFTSKEMKFSSAQRKINKFIVRSGINKVFYSTKSEDHRIFHKHLKYDKEINIYIQKQGEFQILNYFIHSKPINIKFVCSDIKIFQTTAKFDIRQKISELYDFCNILLSDVLGIQANNIKLTLDNRKLSANLDMCIEDALWSVKQSIIYFSYEEK